MINITQHNTSLVKRTTLSLLRENTFNEPAPLTQEQRPSIVNLFDLLILWSSCCQCYHHHYHELTVKVNFRDLFIEKTGLKYKTRDTFGLFTYGKSLKDVQHLVDRTTLSLLRENTF